LINVNKQLSHFSLQKVCIMAKRFNRKAFLHSMLPVQSECIKAAQMGRELARMGIRRIYFVGCGAPNREMSVMEYWLQKNTKKIETRRYFPAEFVAQNPRNLDDKTLILFGSHSGTTPETVRAAEFVQEMPCCSIAITQIGSSPLAGAVQQVLLYGQSPDTGYQHGYYSMIMLILALVGALLDELEGWEGYQPLMRSLPAFPGALADVMEASEKRAIEEARLYHADQTFYLVGSGPMSCTTYVFGVCILMEMQWIHTFPAEAAEWFHGPFEIIDQNTPIFLFMGEDDSRPLMERVVRFCEQFTERLIIYDSREYSMKGIEAETRPLLAPFIIQAALDRLAEHLAVWHNHPLTTRRYMWQMDY
jgi:fructoselysine 6-phosphate deglycase